MGPAQTQWEVLKEDFLILRNQINSLKGIPGGCSYKQHEGILDWGGAVLMYSLVQLLYSTESKAWQVTRVFHAPSARGMTRINSQTTRSSPRLPHLPWRGTLLLTAPTRAVCLRTRNRRHNEVTFLTWLHLLISLSLKWKNYNICTPLPFSMLLH